MVDPPHLRSEFIILIPILDDWQAASLLMAGLDQVLEREAARAIVLIVDDGSITRPGPDFLHAPFEQIEEVRVLHLRSNLGHQRAIAIGLAYLYEHAEGRAVVVMDSDGQDRPEDVPLLIRRLGERADSEVVFAERTRRRGPVWFKALYHLYRCVHWLATGVSVRVGNFSVLPFSLLANLVAVPGLWSHYAASVFHARVPHSAMPSTRGRRLAGDSKMSLVGLVTHGLSALAVFGEAIGTRLFILGSVLFLAASGTLGMAFWNLWQAGSSLVEWALIAMMGTMILLLSMLGVAGGFLFLLYSRNTLAFVPLRDYRFFIKDATTVYPDGSYPAELFRIGARSLRTRCPLEAILERDHPTVSRALGTRSGRGHGSQPAESVAWRASRLDSPRAGPAAR